MTQNDLEGEIPVEICRLSKLRVFDMENNRISGSLPLCISNFTNLSAIGVSFNQLGRTLPRDFGRNLPNLRFLGLFVNQFEGEIPPSLINASHLEYIDLESNKMSGLIPSNLGALQELDILQLENNHFEAGDWSFLSSMANCTKLSTLVLSRNGLKGALPDKIGNLPRRLRVLYMQQNDISGPIPFSIGKLVSLEDLRLFENFFTGYIPDSVGLLTRLKLLLLDNNKLNREIPPPLGKIAQLYYLTLHNNFLTGNIPVTFQGFQNMQILDLSFNSLNATIPERFVGFPSSLVALDLSHNNFIGPLPSQLGNMENLNSLNVSNNKFGGQIPTFIRNMRVLEELHMENNLFEGNIPTILSEMKGLLILDLSNNNLVGSISAFSSNLLLLNLLFNNFQGKVPVDGVFTNISLFRINGNKGLCGGVPQLHLPQCCANISYDTTKKKHMSTNKARLIIIVTSVCIALAGIGLLFLLAWKRKVNSSQTIESRGDKFLRVSYGDLLKATDDFSQENLVGVGTFGSVYRANLGQDENVVAIKVLNLGLPEASKSFMEELNSLKNTRHRNLVKILTSCSGVDYKGNEFKAIIFEFMKNGSLDNLLHPRVDEENSGHDIKKLNISQRVKIAIDIACALDYLHLRCHKPIVHCDLKPSNVLLDDSLVAHVSDFGLARFLFRNASMENEASTSTFGIKGTIGYIAPEYGMGAQISTQGDIYSFGILLLEMFTGRRPTDEIFKDGLSLHQFLKMRFHEGVMDIADPELLVLEYPNSHESVKECVISMIQVGLSCSREEPRDRMEIYEVIREIYAIKGKLLKNGAS